MVKLGVNIGIVMLLMVAIKLVRCHVRRVELMMAVVMAIVMVLILLAVTSLADLASAAAARGAGSLLLRGRGCSLLSLLSQQIVFFIRPILISHSCIIVPLRPSIRLPK